MGTSKNITKSLEIPKYLLYISANIGGLLCYKDRRNTLKAESLSAFSVRKFMLMRFSECFWEN